MDFYFHTVAVLAGLAIGSFLNCLIWRLYREEGVGGRSYCPICRTTLAWHDNIPLLSFIRLKGRCRSCREKISWQYPLVELVTAVLVWLVWSRHQELAKQFDFVLAVSLIRELLLVIFAVVIFVYDLRWQLVPVTFILVMGILLFLTGLLAGASLLVMLFYGCIGGVFFLMQYWLTNKRGIGEGDIWLGVFLGLAFPSWEQLLVLMVVSYGLGSVISIPMLVANKKGWKSAVPLGPFLMAGAVTVLFFGYHLAQIFFGSGY